MSIEEIQALIQNYGIVPNKLLGQNFLVASSIYPKLVQYASLDSNDKVLDVGAGFGFLSRFLAGRCKAVIAVEKDSQIAKVLRDQVRCLGNITLIEGDILKADIPTFNKVISFPPYYLSTQLIVWLLNRGFDSAVIIMQKEFADRLAACKGTREYSWLSVVVFQRTEVELLEGIPKEMFMPKPEIDSVIVRLKPWGLPPFTVRDPDFFEQMLRWLFTQRNKKLGNALIPFLRSRLKMTKADAEKKVYVLRFRDKRAMEMKPKDFGELSDELCQ
jgi:16S rRNA (adenine1518-N6/adenine1519-N6)-dimethyltransferase